MPNITSSRAETFSIGELSKHSGVNIETIRYYERTKMLPAPPRTASGRRVYGPAEKRTLAFIRRSRDLGFTLEEIRALLALALQLPFLQISESMGNHDSKIVDAASVD